MKDYIEIGVLVVAIILFFAAFFIEMGHLMKDECRDLCEAVECEPVWTYSEKCLCVKDGKLAHPGEINR